MEKLVEIIAKALVENPDRVFVNERKDDRGSVMQLQVADEDMGKVIGKQGRIAKALRTVVKAAASRNRETVIVDIVSENESEENAR